MTVEFYLRGRVIISGRLKPQTDLRVGGDELSAGMQFYAPDNPIVRNARGEPIIPGSSLKGVMRSNLDVIYHKDEILKLIDRARKNVSQEKTGGDGKQQGGEDDHQDSGIGKRYYGALICDRPDCWVCRVFGRPAPRPKDTAPVREPTRLRVEDCLLDPESVRELGLEDARSLSVVRTENAILRFFGAANPRRSEYVPAGVRFSLRLVYDVYTPEDVKDGLPLVLEALHHVEDSGLGGGRSRGTGGVKFEDVYLYWKSVEHYRSGNRTGELLAGPASSVAELQKTCQERLQNLAQRLNNQKKE